MKLISEIKDIAIKAGAIILDIYKDQEKFQTTFKSDNSPLTLADQKANEFICNQLSKISQLPIISEENKAIPYKTRQYYDQFWMVDPLDGTKEFVKRNGEFTVNIALIEDGKPVLGVVYAPVPDRLFWGADTLGAYEQIDGKAKQIQVAEFNSKDENLIIVCSRSHMNDETKLYIDQFKNHHLKPQGSSLKIMLVANGTAHIYPRFGPTMEWDTAAAHAILNAAGGTCVQPHGKPLVYNKEDLLNPYFIAKGSDD